MKNEQFDIDGREIFGHLGIYDMEHVNVKVS
jgi:hypothetical protein